MNLIKQLNFIYSLKLALLQQNKEKLFKKLCSCQCLVDFKQFLSIFNDNIFVKSHLYRFCYLTHYLGLANGEQCSVLFSRRWRRGKYLEARTEINGKIQIPTDFCSSSRSTFNNVTGGKTDLVVLFAANFLQPELAWWAKFLDAQWPLSFHSSSPWSPTSHSRPPCPPSCLPQAPCPSWFHISNSSTINIFLYL